MPPKSNKPARPDSWWQDAYGNSDHISVLWEIKHGEDIIKPGSLIKIKNQRGNFKFRCLAHNEVLDVTWLDCVDSGGAFRTFSAGSLKGLIKPKKSRRKKPSV